MEPIWKWLKDDKNRDVVKMTTAGLAAILAGAWAILTFIVDHHTSVTITSGVGGVAAGHDISSNIITITPPSTPTRPETTHTVNSP